MNQLYDVSIIVCFYNAQRYIAGCVDTILKQTKRALQLILIDDGSTDDGLAIARSLACNNDNIQIIAKSNTGLGSSRNVGLSHARGDYVYFLDVDDFLDASAIELLYGAAMAHNADIVYCNSISVCEDAQNASSAALVPMEQRLGGIYLQRDASIAGVLQGRDYVLKSLSSSDSFFVPVWLGLYRKAFLEQENLLFEEIIHEDNIWSMDACLRAKSIFVMPEVLHCRRVVSTSITHKRKSEKHVAGALRVMERAIEVARVESRDKRSRDAFHKWTLMSAGLVYDELMASDAEVRMRYKPAFIALMKNNIHMVNWRLFIKSIVGV